MSNTIRNTKDLNTGKTEALRGLLNSIGHFNDAPSPDTSLSTEQLEKLSEKINEILGDGVDYDLEPGGRSNQLLNEDGLPIIDISEQVDENSLLSPVPEQDPIPNSLLPPDERERRRRERDRILDLLEEEERLQQLQEERDAEEERKDAIRNRKDAAKAELDRLKATRELQRKMGRALVRHVERTVEDRQEEDTRPKPRAISPAARKSVSFADAPTVEADEKDHPRSIPEIDWGDVTPGRLRASGRIPLMSTVEVEKYPMKMRVVERLPAATASPFLNEADSDDESAPLTGPLSTGLVGDDSDEKDGSSSNDDHSSDDEPLGEGFDFDIAQHHREVALEYHKKRYAIGAETAKAMATHTLDDHEHGETSKEQLPLSRFRADRMAAAYDKSHSPVSTSIGQTVIPASRQNSLRNTVRLGKLENDQLVGGPSGESGSEDETVDEVVRMLTTGRIQNCGPDFDPSTVTPPQGFSATGLPPVGTPTTAPVMRPSKFKLARGDGTTEATASRNNSEDEPQSRPTISSVVERKAPNTSSARQPLPANKPPP